MDVIAMVTALADAGAKLADEAKQHEALQNSPAMQMAYVLDGLQKLIDQNRTIISNEDLDAYRIAVSGSPSQPGA